MKAAIFLTFLLIFSFNKPAWTAKAEDEDTQETMMNNIIDRMAKLEAELETRDERISLLEEALGAKEVQKSELKAEMMVLREIVDEVRNPPFAFQCASHYADWYTSNAIITYDKLLYSSMFNVDGGFDITTGIFTAGYPGTWRITASMKSALHSDQTNYVFIYHNDQMIEDSKFLTYVLGSSSINVQSIGSRTLLLHLDAGDTVSLRAGNLGWALSDITFCVELAQFDV